MLLVSCFCSMRLSLSGSPFDIYARGHYAHRRLASRGSGSSSYGPHTKAERGNDV
jgi:hypothetical protein